MRAELEGGKSFADALAARDARLSLGALVPWARWITPEFEPRRYDTFFFVARVPSGQEPDGRTSEAQTAGWARPRPDSYEGLSQAGRMVVAERDGAVVGFKDHSGLVFDRRAHVLVEAIGTGIELAVVKPFVERRFGFV